MPIELNFITHGPNRGKWSWKITADKKLVERGRVRQWGQRNGIATDERRRAAPPSVNSAGT